MRFELHTKAPALILFLSHCIVSATESLQVCQSTVYKSRDRVHQHSTRRQTTVYGRRFELHATMSKLLGLVIIAGLISAGSQQVAKELTKFSESLELAEEPPSLSVSQQLKPLPLLPCYYPTHIQCWTEWFDRDNPSGTGDWELLVNLRQENPGKICAKPQDIEAKTLSGLTPAAAGDVVQMDKDTGFVCKNSDQNGKWCNDYRVRFSCHPPFCGDDVCWTDWFDRDDPSGTGDWETLSSLQQQYPGKFCKKPSHIEVVTVAGNTPAISTGQNFEILNPTEGFVCRNQGQYCLDYKVRFGCCCD